MKLLIKPHHFLDYLYDLAINNRHDEENINGNANGELCRAFINGQIETITFTPLVDDICRPCKCLVNDKCTQTFDDATTENYGYRYKDEFNYQLDIKLNKALPDIFIFNKEQNIKDVLIALSNNLTEEVINLYLWKRPDRVKNTFFGIKKAIEIYSRLKINVLGDSITEGARATAIEKCYVNLLGKMLNAETRNYGISGSRIAPQHNPLHDPYNFSYCERVHKMNKDADYVVIMGGTNDFGHGDAPFGKVGDKSPETYCGAVDYLINELLKDYPKEKIIFIPPLHRENENNPMGDGYSKTVPGETLPKYRSAQIEIIKKYGLHILDIVEEFGPGENNPLLADGLHPNNEGHYLIAKRLAEYIKSINK